MYVYKYTFIYVLTYVYVCVYVCICIFYILCYSYTYFRKCKFEFMYICTNVYINSHTKIDFLSVYELEVHFIIFNFVTFVIISPHEITYF